MKIKFKKVISMLLVLSLVSVFLVPASAALGNGSGKAPLQFNSNGKFKIMMINDTQDTDFTNPNLINLINKALDKENPDLVVFAGDNVADIFIGANETRVAKAIDNIIQPLAKRNIPFAVTFGNHDAETGVSNEKQMADFMSYANCYANYTGAVTPGVGTYNLPILSSNGSKTAFNVYMMDTHDKDSNGGFDGVHADQIAWYEQTSNALKSANGGNVVPSLLFQHIPACEIYKLLKEVPPGTDGAIRNGTKWYKLNENLCTGTGVLLEAPYPNSENRGQYTSWIKQGDIVGAFFGHDHVNSFMGTTEDGITMGYNGGSTFRAYGNGDQRSVRIFNISENDPANYETHLDTYADLTNEHFSFYITDITSIRWLDIILTKLYDVFKALTFGQIIF